ncbi:23097_t:CDS:2, partial [Gigaspora rosea]
STYNSLLESDIVAIKIKQETSAQLVTVGINVSLSLLRLIATSRSNTKSIMARQGLQAEPGDYTAVYQKERLQCLEESVSKIN